MTKKKVVLAILVIVIVIIILANELVQEERSYYDLSNVKYDRSKYINNLDLLNKFIENKMVIENIGIKTNFLDSQETKNYATGHEVLSESVGLMLLASLNNQSNFDYYAKILEKHFINQYGLVDWRIDSKGNSLATVNASIDDLRIIRALTIAANQWEGSYQNLAKELMKALLEYNVLDGLLYDYYDGYNKTNIITICYLDLHTMKKLNSYDSTWGKISDNSVDYIYEHLISKKAPFFTKDNTSGITEFLSREINMIEHMLTLYHLAEVGKLDKNIYDFIKAEFNERGYLPARYSLKFNRIISPIEMESTAVYAIAALIAERVGDSNFFYQMLDKMIQFQVLDNISELYGAFGNEQNLEVYSYDNLMALVALEESWWSYEKD